MAEILQLGWSGMSSSKKIKTGCKGSSHDFDACLRLGTLGFKSTQASCDVFQHGATQSDGDTLTKSVEIRHVKHQHGLRINVIRGIIRKYIRCDRGFPAFARQACKTKQGH